MSQNNPRKAKKLQDIYNRPSYYSGYYLRSIKGNIKYQGFIPAEINHSSNVTYFGNGNNWTVMKQINEMMKRQKSYEKPFKVAKESLYVLGYNLQVKTIPNKLLMIKKCKNNIKWVLLQELLHKCN